MKHAAATLAGLALLCQTPAFATPTLLVDSQLDGITAGTTDYGSLDQAAGGGAIVGNGAKADITLGGDVTVEGSAQTGATALNMTNSSESAVANGVNIWDGRLTGPVGVETANLTVNQVNEIVQSHWGMSNQGTASVPLYDRPQANVTETLVSSRATTSKGEVDTKLVILGNEIKAGEGVAIAGNADLNIDAGSVSFNPSFETTVEGGSGLSLGGGYIGSGSISAKTTIKSAIDLTWNLPSASLRVDAAGCYAVAGSCKAEGTVTETKATSSTVRSPFQLVNAKAEYIVVDDAELTVRATNSVRLADGAQQNVRVMNLVNAAGSAVANGVNISRTSFTGLTLNQQNLIVQTR